MAIPKPSGFWASRSKWLACPSGLDHFANGIIAKRIVELAGAGERNPDLLCQAAIEELRGHLCSD
jgi:hypothetical protein